MRDDLHSMKRWTLISLAGLAVLIACAAKERARSMRPDRVTPKRTHSAFDRRQSVALFVGARTFTVDNVEMVPYAVDDAVDLAYTFAIDQRVALVPPQRVVLALSDPTPSKPDSRKRLAELKRHGAIVVPATQSQIFKLLHHQTATVGPGGIFIVSFATHGFSEDGSQYLLAGDSLFREFHTAIPAAHVFDVVARSRALRSLILIDACRERVIRRRGDRRGEPEQASAAPLIQRMSLIEGQVVLYAAAAGKWAYDDDIRRNGVFTGAVLDGLQCRAGHDRSGMVTIDALSAMVERSVLSWIRINRDASIRNATQVSIDGAARAMPLAVCSRPEPKLPEGGDEGSSNPPPLRVSLRPLLEQCRKDGATLIPLYDSQEPDRFVKDYLTWRDDCVSVLRDLDRRLPQGKTGAGETAHFLSIANLWCATQCPKTFSPGQRALFQEKSRAERCFWDLDEAVEEVDAILVRNASALR